MRDPVDGVETLSLEYHDLLERVRRLEVPEELAAERSRLEGKLAQQDELLTRYALIGKVLEHMNLTDGIKQILWEAVEPMKVKDIIQALEDRGCPCHAKNKDTSIRTTLMRSKDVIRTGTGYYKLVEGGA